MGREQVGTEFDCRRISVIAQCSAGDKLTVDLLQVGFFLKISKEIGKAWREARESHTPALCFQPRSRPFV